MAERKQRGADVQTVIPPADPDRLAVLVADARRGDPTACPPLGPSQDASELGRRIVRALDLRARDPESDDPTRSGAHADLCGLAVTGAAAAARREIRRAEPFRIRRNGNLTTIARSFSVPTHLIDGAAPSGDGEDDDGPEMAPARRSYIQIDFASWELLEWLREHLAARRDGLGVTVTLLDEILKLKDVHPGLGPRDAMLAAGLDPDTLQIDLDEALASLDDDQDVGVRDGT